MKNKKLQSVLNFLIGVALTFAAINYVITDSTRIYIHDLDGFGDISCINQDDIRLDFTSADVRSMTRRRFIFPAYYITVNVHGDEKRLYASEKWVCVKPNGEIQPLWPKV